MRRAGVSAWVWAGLGLVLGLVLGLGRGALAADAREGASAVAEAADAPDSGGDAASDDQAFDFGDDARAEAPEPNAADAPDGSDDQAFDFGDAPAAAAVEPTPGSTLSLAGFLRSDVGLWVERLGSQPLAKARQSLDLMGSWRLGRWSAGLALHGEHDLATHVDASRLDAATIDAYRALVDLRRAWLGLELGDLGLTTGLQVLNWGEGDALSVVDVTNPKDLREPGLADLNDLRLPALMTRLGLYRGAHRVELLWIHEGFYGYRTPPLGPFSPLPALLQGATGVDVGGLLGGRELAWRHDPPRLAWEAQQWLGRWAWRGSGLDLALLGGLALDQQGVVGLPSREALAASGDLGIPLQHRRYGLVATTGALPLDSFVLRWELAVGLARPFNTADPEASPLAAVGVARSDTVGGLFGVAWSGLADTLVALEVAQTTPLRADLDFFVPPDLPQVALRASHRALRDQLRLLAVVTSFGLAAELGWLARLDADWRLRDGLEVGLGYIHYGPTARAGPLAGLDRHDRLSLRFRWDFNGLDGR
jgi:hypothetical protein